MQIFIFRLGLGFCHHMLGHWNSQGNVGGFVGLLGRLETGLASGII